MKTGKKLNQRWKVGAEHALYNEPGCWYHKLKVFPGALFDTKGYIVFKTAEEYLSCPDLQHGKHLNVPKGIAAIPGYVQVVFDGIEYIPPGPAPRVGERNVYFEGKARTIELTRYERSRDARAKCLNHYGQSCHVCGFNFEEKYGEIAKSIIHVHHMIPLTEIGGEYEINPITDLRPVCPNCHAVIHSRDPAFSIEELRRML
ncbi:HNH endonuclease [Candidatus Latescibacterota bacterium]